VDPARDELVQLDVDPRVEISERLRRDQDLDVPVIDRLSWLFARIGQLTSHRHILQQMARQGSRHPIIARIFDSRELEFTTAQIIALTTGYTDDTPSRFRFGSPR
jgi:hypothetical protein